MKTLKFLAFFIAAALFFSCEKDTPEKLQTFEAEIEFGISHIMPTGAKDLPADGTQPPVPTCPQDLNPVSATIEIREFDGYDPAFPEDDIPLATGELVGVFSPEVFFDSDGRLYSQTFSFKLGDDNQKDLVVTQFVIRDGNGEIIMATPETPSDFDVYVTNPLPMKFTAEAYQKKQIPIEVLCFIPSEAENFGFNWFQIDQVVVRHFHIFGNICGYTNEWDLADFVNTPYDDLFDLSVDMPALFIVTVTDTEGNMAKPDTEYTYANFEYDNGGWIYHSGPLKVDYPDYLGRTNNFEFKLEIVRPGNNGLQFEEYVLTATDDGEIKDEDDNPLVDRPILFVLGGCSVDGAHDIVIIPE